MKFKVGQRVRFMDSGMDPNLRNDVWIIWKISKGLIFLQRDGKKTIALEEELSRASCTGMIVSW